MANIQRAGGWSALLIAASYVFGFGLFLGLLDRTGYDGPMGDLAFVVDHQTWLATAMIALYVIAGLALVVLVFAIDDRLAPSRNAWNRIASSFGVIWAGIVIASGFVGLIGIRAVTDIAASAPEIAASAWLAISVVQNALGGGIELVGGVWLVLVSWIALQSGALPRLLNYLGFAIGILGILSVFPALADLTALFGLSQILWFIWIAYELMARKSH